jgi:hypothetical protein
MTKRFFIISFIVLFTITTSGMPLIAHYCNSMDSFRLWNSIQFGENCIMHQSNIEEISCCESENESDLIISNSPENCCLDQVIDNSVKDDFISSADYVKTPIQFISFQPLNDYSFESVISESLLILNNSPPKFLTNKIYLSISIFLI